MTAFEELKPVELPEWVGQPLTGKGAPGDAGTLDTTAVSSDVAGTALESAFLNPIGATAVFVAQYRQSVAKGRMVRIAECAAAFGVDWGLGIIPVLPPPIQPLVPVVDTLVLTPFSRLWGCDLGIATNINGTLRGLGALVDSTRAGSGSEEGVVRARARAEMGDMGEGPRLIAAALTLFNRAKRALGSD
jgi:hypothetical protein